MKVISETPERLVLSRTNLIGGLICLALTPLTGFLGVMMILDEPPALGWILIGLTVIMVGISILAMMAKTRLVLDLEQDIARLSTILPWIRKHREIPLSHVSAVEVKEDPRGESDKLTLELSPKPGLGSDPIKIGIYLTYSKAEAVQAPIERWLGRAVQTP